VIISPTPTPTPNPGSFLPPSSSSSKPCYHNQTLWLLLSNTTSPSSALLDLSPSPPCPTTSCSSRRRTRRTPMELDAGVRRQRFKEACGMPRSLPLDTVVSVLHFLGEYTGVGSSLGLYACLVSVFTKLFYTKFETVYLMNC
jgi:hypothetical protein